MKKLILLAAVASAAALFSGCNGMQNWRIARPFWCHAAPGATTSFDPSKPYVDGGYVVPQSGVSELPAPGPDGVN